MHVEVVYALPDAQHVVHLELPAGTPVAAALDAVARVPPFDGLDLGSSEVGIYGRPVERHEILSPEDRLEIYRPLLVDPMEARRRRARDESG